jgi:uncharacterized protein (UPF0276 family)
MALFPAQPLPPRAGIGLKAAHYAPFLGAASRGESPAWVEVHPQNYFCAGGPTLRWLGAIREAVPVSFHSVGLSLGSPQGPDAGELAALAALTERFEPAQVSDHLSWSILDGDKMPDLLPVPMTTAALNHFVRSVDLVQERLGRAILIENPSRLLGFRGDSYSESGFLIELARRSGCGLLVDVNNILVGAINLGFDPNTYVDEIAGAPIGEIHIAGHKVEVDADDGARTAIDDHGSPVSEECWSLLERLLAKTGPLPVLLERDNQVPAYDELAAEAMRADRLLTRKLANAA